MKSDGPSSPILFSVVIPTFNRPDRLRRCLSSLHTLNYDPESYEVLVVDDGSTVSYNSLQEEFPEVRWLRQPNGGPGPARNFGVSQARGRFIAFTDDDCMVHPDWLRELTRVFEAQPEALIGGATPPAAGAGLYDQVSQFINELVYNHYNKDCEKAHFFASNNMAVSARNFEEVGGFCLEHTRNAAEDRTLCNIYRSFRYPLIWERAALVFHKPELTFTRFCRTYFRYGRGAYTYQKARRSGSLVSEMGFHAALPRNIVETFKSYPELPIGRTLFLLLVWQVCNLAGFLWQVKQGDNF